MTPEHDSPKGQRPAVHVVPPTGSENQVLEAVAAALGDVAESEDEALEAIATSMGDVATVIQHLTAQLNELTEALGRTKTFRATEAEIGRLFARAQAYVEDAIGDAEERAHRVVAEAEVEAGRIIESAHVQAAEIVESARRETILRPEAVARLSTTIEGFSRMNVELVQELSRLRASLAPIAQPAPPPDPSTIAAPGAFAMQPPPVAAPLSYPPPSGAPLQAEVTTGDRHRLAG